MTSDTKMLKNFLSVLPSAGWPPNSPAPGRRNGGPNFLGRIRSAVGQETSCPSPSANPVGRRRICRTSAVACPQVMGHGPPPDALPRRPCPGLSTNSRSISPALSPAPFRYRPLRRYPCLPDICRCAPMPPATSRIAGFPWGVRGSAMSENSRSDQPQGLPRTMNSRISQRNQPT